MVNLVSLQIIELHDTVVKKGAHRSIVAILEIAKLGNPVLREKARPVLETDCLTPEFQTFLDDMIETMEELDGLGLAAPQVSRSLAVIVIKSQGNLRYPEVPTLPLLVLMNPKITHLSEEMTEGWEGCLSIQNLRGKVKRHARISVSGQDRDMKPIALDVEGFLAIVLQHEIDHLKGKVFLDRMGDLSTLTHLAEFNQYWMSRQETV